MAEHDAHLPPGRPSATPPAPDTRRRRLLQGGLGAAPVLMSVASRPVMAAGERCVAPSSFTSLNVSGETLSYPCSGHKPDWWKQPQQYSQWPSANNKNTAFDTVFGSYNGYPGKTLLDVLNLPAGDIGRDGLARHIVAALLNAQKTWTPSVVLGVTAVKAIWTSFVKDGYYEPTAGVRWYADTSTPANAGGGLIAYLKSTMPLA